MALSTGLAATASSQSGSSGRPPGRQVDDPDDDAEDELRDECALAPLAELQDDAVLW